VAENIVTQKVGPLPLVVWVAGGAGVIGLFILLTHKGNNGASANQTNSVSALAPTSAEAFGTIEQQQQDVVNALTTLGQNQSALGGSMSTLTGIVTQQGQDNAAAFQNLVDGQNTIQQGQAAASSQATNYYKSLLNNMQNYYASLGNQINGVNTNVISYGSNNISYQGDVYNEMINMFGLAFQQDPLKYAELQQQFAGMPAGDSPGSWLYKIVGGQNVAYMQAHPSYYPGAYGNPAYESPIQAPTGV